MGKLKLKLKLRFELAWALLLREPLCEGVVMEVCTPFHLVVALSPLLGQWVCLSTDDYNKPLWVEGRLETIIQTKVGALLQYTNGLTTELTVSDWNERIWNLSVAFCFSETT
jgi:hypothetical protein